MKNRFITWLRRWISPDTVAFVLGQLKRLGSDEVRPALAEDLRKAGVAAAGIGLVGAIVNSASIARGDALIVLLFGGIIWIAGLWLTSLDSKKE
ncbi:hypothetical protein [Eoetvoesiella caeni]